MKVEAIFKTIGYTLNNVSEEFNNGTTNYDISIHDGFGMDVTGNCLTILVVRLFEQLKKMTSNL